MAEIEMTITIKQGTTEDSINIPLDSERWINEKPEEFFKERVFPAVCLVLDAATQGKRN